MGLIFRDRVPNYGQGPYFWDWDSILGNELLFKGLRVFSDTYARVATLVKKQISSVNWQNPRLGVGQSSEWGLLSDNPRHCSSSGRPQPLARESSRRSTVSDPCWPPTRADVRALAAIIEMLGNLKF